jgi:hypothetical protein
LFVRHKDSIFTLKIALIAVFIVFMGEVVFNFICINDKCNKHCKNVHIQKDISLEEEIESCEECQEPLKQLGHTSYAGYLKSSGMSVTEKKAMLKKRSKDHFTKSGLQEKQKAMLKTSYKD